MMSRVIQLGQRLARGPDDSAWHTPPDATVTAAASKAARRDRAARLLVFASAWVLAIGAVAIALDARWFYDARVYWLAWHGGLYAHGFVYPPPGALLVLPAAILPWPVFLAGWMTTLALAGAWCLWPLPLWLRVPLLALLAASISWGNAATLLAVALVLALRWPALWAVLAWTKVTPLVALLGLVRRRAWRDLAAALAACTVVGAGAVAVAPGMTLAWLAQLQAHPEIPRFLPALLPISLPLVVRIPLAAIVVWVGAQRPWTYAVAAAIASPDLTLATVGLLAAVPRLAQQESPVSSKRRLNAQPGVPAVRGATQ